MRLNYGNVNSWSPGGLHVPSGFWSSLCSGNWCHTNYRHRGLVILSHHGKSLLLFTPIPHFNQVHSQYLIGWDHQWQWDGNIHPPSSPCIFISFHVGFKLFFCEDGWDLQDLGAFAIYLSVESFNIYFNETRFLFSEAQNSGLSWPHLVSDYMYWSL